METRRNLTRILLIGILSIFSLASTGRCQNLDVPYVPTPAQVVSRMLDVTHVGPGDYVIDLGSGDGRIVIAAAERGAAGMGIDLNPERIREAEENALNAGVTDKVLFVQGDLFEADISHASVVTMYLLNSVNLRLRPVLLETLRPGTRVVSHAFSMGEWEPDLHTRVDNRNVYLWIIPARVQGTWEWDINGESFTMSVNQEFQKINLRLNSGEQTLAVRDPVLSGERISFMASNQQTGDQYLFSGFVEDNTINGTAHIRNGEDSAIESWTATFRR